MLLLSSCSGSTKWAHTYKTESDFNSDLASCRYYASQIAQEHNTPMSETWPDTMDNYPGAWNAENAKAMKTLRNVEEKRCLKERGWRKEFLVGFHQ